MNILYLSSDFPYPLTSGGRRKGYTLFKELAKHHSITMLAFCPEPVSPSDKDAIKHIFNEMRLVPFALKHSIGTFVKSLVSSIPYKVLQYQSDEYRRQFQDLITTQHFDLIISESLFFAPYYNDVALPVIPQNNDMVYNVYQRFSKGGNLIMRLYSMTQWRKILAYEQEVYKRHGIFIAVSDDEVALAKNLVPTVTTCLIRNGVDTTYFSPPEKDITEEYSIVLTGVYSYFPNEQAALYFATRVFPYIKQRIPQARYYIVGKNPTKAIQRLAEDPSIIVTGMVDDMRPYIAKAAVIIVPVLVGGGTRTKIVEAMAMQKPIVSTTLGAEGIPVEHKKNIIIADGDEQFGNAVVELLRNRDVADSIAKEGRTLVESEYRWDVISKKFNNFVIDFVETTRKRTNKGTGQ